MTEGGCWCYEDKEVRGTVRVPGSSWRCSEGLRSGWGTLECRTLEFIRSKIDTPCCLGNFGWFTGLSLLVLVKGNCNHKWFQRSCLWAPSAPRATRLRPSKVLPHHPLRYAPPLAYCRFETLVLAYQVKTGPSPHSIYYYTPHCPSLPWILTAWLTCSHHLSGRKEELALDSSRLSALLSRSVSLNDSYKNLLLKGLGSAHPVCFLTQSSWTDDGLSLGSSEPILKYCIFTDKDLKVALDMSACRTAWTWTW